MGTDLVNTITNESPLTIAIVYFAIKTIILVLEITKLSSGSDSFHLKFQVMQKAKP